MSESVVVTAPSRSFDRWIQASFTPICGIMNDVTYCDLCDMDREFCGHGLAQRRRNVTATSKELLISPTGVALPEIPA